MSLYREAGASRWRRVAAAAATALLIGLAMGFATGRATAPEPQLDEQLARLRDRVQPVMNGIELVPDHYAQGVRDGEIIGTVQYSGAQQQAGAARSSLEAVAGDLELLDPAGLEGARAAVEELSAAIDRRESPQRVRALADRAAAAVAAAAGIDAPR